MSEVRARRSRLTSRLQFGRDMCQSSLLAEGNLKGCCRENLAVVFEACAKRKIKI